jgi:hypothetical protein
MQGSSCAEKDTQSTLLHIFGCNLKVIDLIGTQTIGQAYRIDKPWLTLPALNPQGLHRNYDGR